MESNSFEIRAIVCDLGNHTLRSELGIVKGNFFFNNPFDSSRVVCIFPDSPHLLKLCRNNLLDKRFMVPAEDGTLVPLDKNDFEGLLMKDSGEYLKLLLSLNLFTFTAKEERDNEKDWLHKL
ncbi:unnamed protein product [Lepeophtheirus salmonis]|uniref:(salmon louse) hypothetical protein n=1 Tax=Lepeophtheirus salmonis TaxID=72036 RepID=A0A0K2UQP9_LEPSM|nr:unnamed protein product [Lepeophtheirus salmonis]CAF2848679.1 unnamed protein product [Lepeophtheirus salmonis]